MLQTLFQANGNLDVLIYYKLLKNLNQTPEIHPPNYFGRLRLKFNLGELVQVFYLY